MSPLDPTPRTYDHQAVYYLGFFFLYARYLAYVIFLENRSSPLDLALFTSSVYLTAAPSHLPIHLSALPRATELQFASAPRGAGPSSDAIMLTFPTLLGGAARSLHA